MTVKQSLHCALRGLLQQKKRTLQYTMSKDLKAVCDYSKTPLQGSCHLGNPTMALACLIQGIFFNLYKSQILPLQHLPLTLIQTVGGGEEAVSANFFSYLPTAGLKFYDFS